VRRSTCKTHTKGKQSALRYRAARAHAKQRYLHPHINMGLCSSSAKVAAVDRTTTTNASSLFIAAPDSAAYYSEENSNDTFDAFTREEPSSLHAMPFVVRPKVCYEINLPRIEEGSRIVEDDSPVLGSHCIGDEAIIGAVSTSAVTNTVTTATYYAAV
jgi:hypothetical protein